MDLKRALSLLTAAALSVSIIPAAFAANQYIDFEGAQADWSYSLAEEFKDNLGSKKIDGVDGVTVVFNGKAVGNPEGTPTTAKIVDEDGDKHIEFVRGQRAIPTVYYGLVIDDMPESVDDGDDSTVVEMSFRAKHIRGTSSPALNLGLNDGSSLSFKIGENGVVANEWQQYIIVLSAQDKKVSVSVDGAVIEIETDATAFGAINDKSSALAGTICIDDISVTSRTNDNSPESVLDRYLDAIMPPSTVRRNVSLINGNNLYDIKWETSNEAVIAKDGTVTPQVNDTAVTVTATGKPLDLSIPARTLSKTVTVAGIGDLTKEQRDIELAMVEIGETIGKGDPFATPDPDATSDPNDTSEPEYSTIWISEDFKLPVSASSNGWIATEWSSDSDTVKIFNDYARIQPPIEEHTLVNLTARVYCPVNPSISCEKTYQVGILQGGGSYDANSLEVYADINFDNAENSSVSVSQTATTVQLPGGQAELVAGVRGGGANSTTFATVSGGELNMTNAQFADTNRNCYFRFTKTPEFSLYDNNEQVVLSFKAKLSKGSSDTLPEIHINRQLRLGADYLGVEYDTYFKLTLVADYGRSRLIIITKDTDDNIISINDVALQLTNFSTIENASALNNGTVTIDDVKLEAISGGVSRISINTGMPGASVALSGMKEPVIAGTDGSVSYYLTKGEYTVKVSYPKYYTETVSVGCAGKDRTYDVKLLPKIPDELIADYTKGVGTSSNQGLNLVYANGGNIVTPDKETGMIEPDAVYAFGSDIKAVSTDVDEDHSDIFDISLELTEASIIVSEDDEDKTPTETLPDDLSLILKADGTVVPLYENSISGKVIATVSAEGTDRTEKKEFNVVINSIKGEMDRAANMLKSSGIKFNGANAATTAVNNNVVLPVIDSSFSNIGVEWESGNSEYLTNEGALVKLPAEETDVTMTARVYFEKNGIKYVQDEVFTVKIASKSSVEALLVSSLNSINLATDFASIDTRGTNVDLSRFVSEDFYLKKMSNDGKYQYEWTSGSDVIVIENMDDESDVAKFYPKKDATRDSKEGIRAKITVKVFYEINGRALAEASKDIEFSTLFDDTKDGKYKVRGDMACADNFAVVYNGSTKQITDLSTVSSDITGLKTLGYFGSLIAWNSSATVLTTSSSKISVKPASSTVNATLSVTVSDSASSESHGTIAVALSVPGTGGSGGGGGSTGSNGGSTIIGGVTGTTPVAASSAFTDLSSVEWARTAIEALASKGVVSGKQNGVFAPNDNVTRAEFAQMLIKAMNLADASAQTDALSDVHFGDWYYNSVASAYNKGIISGYENGEFGVNDLITRQDMAAIVYRAANAAGKNLAEIRTMSFDDEAEIAAYAHDAVMALANAGIINGMSDSEFAPTGTATRAQAAVIIYNIAK